MVIFHSYVSLPEGIQSQLASLAVLFVVDYMLMIVDAHSAPILQGCWRLILNFPIPLLKNVYMIKTHFGDHFTGWWFGTYFIFHNIWDNPSH